MNTNNKKKSKLLKDKLKGNDVLWLIIAVFAIILSIKTEVSLTSTLFPICIPWMEFETTLLFLMCILFLLQNYKAKRKGGKEEYNYSWIFKTILWLIIIPASVALPNRYIPISNTRIHTGKVVDKTRSKMPTKTTGGWQNYVKIKIDGENTYFWYNIFPTFPSLNKSSKKAFSPQKTSFFSQKHSSDTSQPCARVSVSAMQPFFLSLCLLPLLQHY